MACEALFKRLVFLTLSSIEYRLMFKLFKPFLVIVSVIFSASISAQWQSFSHVAMTTPIELFFWEEDSDKAEQISQAVFNEFDRIEQKMSRYIDTSELSNINRNAALKNVQVSESLFNVLESAMDISKLSNGAFDISFASVGYMYDYRKKQMPSQDVLDKKLELFHYENILLDKEKQSIHFTKPGIVIDLGGIAKGYSVDKGIEILKKAGIESAHLSAGGDMRLIGDKRGKPWIIGIKNPFDETLHALVLPLSETAISTSGDYERYFMDDKGERVHHILSPKTGKSAKGLRSVTILANDAITSDGLSTAVFVLGLKQGLGLINKLDGIDAIIIDDNGKVFYSNGLMRPEIPAK